MWAFLWTPRRAAGSQSVHIFSFAGSQEIGFPRHHTNLHTHGSCCLLAIHKTILLYTMCQKLTSVCILLGFIFSDRYSHGTLQMQKLREEGLSFQSHKAGGRTAILTSQPGSRENDLDHYPTVAPFASLRRSQAAEMEGPRRRGSSVACSSYLVRPFSARHSWNSTYWKMGHKILQGNLIISLFSADEAADWSHGLQRKAHTALEDLSLAGDSWEPSFAFIIPGFFVCKMGCW